MSAYYISNFGLIFLLSCLNIDSCWLRLCSIMGCVCVGGALIFEVALGHYTGLIRQLDGENRGLLLFILINNAKKNNLRAENWSHSEPAVGYLGTLIWKYLDGSIWKYVY